jgi:membrane-bound metal-dependent hydrolase YbcI (DUF457 family)
MNGTTHMAFGGTSFALLAGPVASIANWPDIPTQGISGALAITGGLAIGSVAGLLPDIDEPNALLGRGGWMPRAFGPILRFAAMIISLPFRLAGIFIKGTLGHRGGTHSFAMSIIFSLLFAIPITIFFGSSADWVVWTIWVGFISHLVADSLNPSGVPWFWPLLSKHKTFHILPSFLRIPTESPPTYRETLIRWACLASTTIIVIFWFVIPQLNTLTLV